MTMTGAIIIRRAVKLKAEGKIIIEVVEVVEGDVDV